jgi:hypothetical protein
LSLLAARAERRPLLGILDTISDGALTRLLSEAELKALAYIRDPSRASQAPVRKGQNTPVRVASRVVFKPERDGRDFRIQLRSRA